MSPPEVCRRRPGWLVGLCAGLLSIHSGGLSAAEELSELQSAVVRLKQENADLRQKLDAQAQSIEQLMTRLAALEQKPPAALPAAATMPGMESARDTAAIGIPRATLQWFGDVNFRVDGEVRGGQIQPSSFGLGQLGLMVNTRLAPNASVMSEIVFQYKEDQAASTTIERLQLQYNASDLVNFRVGRTHTPFGYWNETYHHGTWFQTSALRPEILRFHDGGSVLPIHSVGLEMYGFKSYSAADINYNVGLANGRGKTYTDTENNHDLNAHKAVYAVLSLAPASVPGLHFGINGYWDAIPPVSGVLGRSATLNERILGAHVVYLRDRLELLSEATRIEHGAALGSGQFDTTGLYAQAGFQIGLFKGYYRYDRLNVGEGDPYYGPLVVDVTRHTLGVRWDLITWAALKFEYHHIDQANLTSPHAYYTQGTFTF